MFHVRTVCSRSSYPFHIVTYKVKWATTSWTDGINHVLYTIDIHTGIYSLQNEEKTLYKTIVNFSLPFGFFSPYFFPVTKANLRTGTC